MLTVVDRACVFRHQATLGGGCQCTSSQRRLLEGTRNPSSPMRRRFASSARRRSAPTPALPQKGGRGTHAWCRVANQDAAPSPLGHWSLQFLGIIVNRGGCKGLHYRR